MKLTSSENAFITHIRTLQLKKQSIRKELNSIFVSIPLSVIRDKYFPTNYQLSIDKLKNEGEIEMKQVPIADGNSITKFKVVKEGPIDFSLLDNHSRRYTHLELMLKGYLRWVSMKPGIEVTLYFEQFLKHKQKQLDKFFFVDTFSGRVHSPITSLKGSLRRDLLIKGEQVVSLDIAQIQPLLLSNILLENIGQNEFSEWINQGEDIYLKFKEKLNLSNREEAKTKFYEITFGKANKRLGEMFGNSPWITWINEVKSHFLPQNPNSESKNHSNLAWLLQSTEVRIMSIIWQKLVDNDIIFLTVHDEIIVRESDVDETHKIMEHELKFHFPIFKINRKENPNSIDLDHLKSRVQKLNSGLLYTKNELAIKHHFSYEELSFLEVNEMLLPLDCSFYYLITN